MFARDAAECVKDRWRSPWQINIPTWMHGKEPRIHYAPRSAMEVAGGINLSNARQVASHAIRDVASNVCTDAACCVFLASGCRS